MGHSHTHGEDIEHRETGSELSEMQRRILALETVLTEKGYIDPAALDKIVEAYETQVGPHIGARIVARAWCDAAFKAELLADANKAIASLGMEQKVGDHLVAVENTPDTHNMIVCTLCSCYPWDVLGLPPVWYKSAPYRSRAICYALAPPDWVRPLKSVPSPEFAGGGFDLGRTVPVAARVPRVLNYRPLLRYVKKQVRQAIVRPAHRATLSLATTVADLGGSRQDAPQMEQRRQI